MADVRLTAAALADLDEIDENGVTNFGSELADAYSRGFGSVFARLRRYPRSGPSAPELGDGVRTIRYRQHRLYYVIENGDVEVLRVFHVARDVQDSDFQ
ncbi:type II toxin-antitoxin system RelE/ParE family toxin [Novosphingobium sp. CCH12-A3]|uniref:type II toxin-antitoxin system RelE/ParE family toxin n=1 Tax=Novosphingobium sp. CCH12-A3 TaxID=1768752 RepID=UPI000783C791|nr:type II toxin-antitoxin system RelE/ParE family toxin [Novosphingobium sp. CCH12-A3]